MKKLIIISMSIALVTALFSCKKDNSKQQSPTEVALVKTDTTTRPKVELANCSGPGYVVSAYPNHVNGNPTNGVIVGTFPTSPSVPYNLLNQQTWIVTQPVGIIGGYINYVLVNQTDGNLVLYKGGYPNNLIPIWSTNIQGQGPVQYRLQNDWNFVGYRTSPFNAVWDTGTYQFKCSNWTHNPQILLFLRNDGDVEVIARVGNGTTTATAILASSQTANGTANPNHNMVRYQSGQNEWTIY